MFYVLMVSHGNFAPGLLSAAEMIAGQHDTVMAVGLKDGMNVEALYSEITDMTAGITSGDHILVLGDLLGGSPLTTMMKALADKGVLGNTRAIAGMNLPMAITAILFGEQYGDELVDKLVSESRCAVAEFKLELDSDEDEI